MSKHGLYQFVGDSGEPLDEFFDPGAILQILEQGLDRDPGPLEDPRAADHVGVPLHGLTLFPREHEATVPHVRKSDKFGRMAVGRASDRREPTVEDGSPPAIPGSHPMPMTDDIDRFTALAIELADAARPIALRYFRSELETVTKDDDSPVTIADRECEAVMRDLIHAAFPEHGIIGEEHGSDRPDATYVWVLDPIDGTKSFITGRPLFGSLIALCRDGKPIVGVIDCSAVNDRWVGAAGRATTHNGKPCRARRCERLSDAYLYATSPFMFEGKDRDGFHELCRRVKYPIFGNDCHGYGLVASGWADFVVEAQLKVYDYAALIPVAAGAGGVITDWNGDDLDLHSDGRVVLAGDSRRHREALDILNAG